MDLKLRGKNAIVTGGSRGIGRSIALRLAEEGCNVAICGRTPEDLQNTSQLLRGHNVLTVAAVADVSRPGEVDRFITEAAAALGGIDYLVANAGGSVGGGLLEATTEDWIRTFDLNLLHAVSAIRAAVPHMRSRGGGSALFVASISAGSRYIAAPSMRRPRRPRSISLAC
jgi:3-oxoacyl-[acyl-carrier protein] reductase